MKKLIVISLFFFCSYQGLHAQSDIIIDTAMAIDEDDYDDDVVPVKEVRRELEKPVLRNVSADSIRKLKSKPEFGYMQYADSFMRSYAQPEESNEQSGKRVEDDEAELIPDLPVVQSLQILYWIIAVVLVVWLLFKIFNGKNSLFARNKKRAIITEEVTEEDTDGKPLEQLIEKAISAKDYRLAIRYWYLHTLQILGEKDLISLAPQKTNHQYLRELNDKPYSANFSKLTLQYEYVWYGEFKLDNAMFSKIQEGFKTFKNQVV
jgi:hypothetical protein